MNLTPTMTPAPRLLRREEEQMSEQTTANTKLILIVDDSEDIRVLLSDFLQDEGYNVICAEDSSTTLMQAQDHHPDLILMDISLPGINGWQTVQYLRKKHA